jgi:hypothetical protein
MLVSSIHSHRGWVMGVPLNYFLLIPHPHGKKSRKFVNKTAKNWILMAPLLNLTLRPYMVRSMQLVFIKSHTLVSLFIVAPAAIVDGAFFMKRGAACGDCHATKILETPTRLSSCRGTRSRRRRWHRHCFGQTSQR